MVMWYLKYLITFGLINGGIFALGVLASYQNDVIMRQTFSMLFLLSLSITSIWLAITLKRGNKKITTKQTAI